MPGEATILANRLIEIVRNEANWRRSFKWEVASVRQTKPSGESSGSSRFAEKRLAASLRTRLCRAKRSQFPPAGTGGQGQARSPMALPLGQSVPNEANCRADSSGPGSARRPCRRWGRSCETKPIFPQALYGKGVVSRRQPTGILRNKANCHRRAGMGEGGQGRPWRYDWVKACETKPIAARTTMGQGRQGTSAAGGTNRAKQSQFHVKCFMGKELRHAGSPRGFCETKPIPAGGQERARAGKVAHAATTGSKRAKRSQFPHGQQWARVGKVPVPPVGPIVRNEANSPTSALWERSCVTSAAHGDSAKQSQFPRDCGFREICCLW